MRVFLSALVVVLAFAQACPAQSRTQSSGSTSRFSSSSTQGLTSGGTFSGSGGSSRSSGTSGMSGLQSSALQAATGTELLRSSRGAENFVGADSGDTRNFLGYSDTGSTANRSAAGATRNRSLGRQSYSVQSNRNTRQNGRTSNRGRASQATELQPTLSLGFAYRVPEGLSARLIARLQQSKSLSTVASVQVRVQDGTATLVGTAADRHEAQLIEQMLALEPGVRRVENQLTVAATASPTAQ